MKVCFAGLCSLLCCVGWSVTALSPKTWGERFGILNESCDKPSDKHVSPLLPLPSPLLSSPSPLLSSPSPLLSAQIRSVQHAGLEHRGMDDALLDYPQSWGEAPLHGGDGHLHLCVVSSSRTHTVGSGLRQESARAGNTAQEQQAKARQSNDEKSSASANKAQGEPSQGESAQGDGAKKSLSQQWEDYLVSPITQDQRSEVLGTLSEAERADLEATLAKTKYPIDAIAAQVYLKRIVELGPRISGSAAMKVQQRAMRRFFTDMGATVASQTFTVPNPETRQNTELVNLIVQLHPEKKNRILFCCHYDTRPFADRDPVDPKAPLPGANDGASGVAFLMVLAPHLQKLDHRWGIDLVFFDAEELVYEKPRDPLFLGSTHFAEQYAFSPPDHTYRAGVLVDMIADKNLELYFEKNSLKAAGPLTKSIWQKAKKLGIAEFVDKPLHQVRDDHLPLNEIAKIPTTDLIDFDYPQIDGPVDYWHTTQDTPDKCSPVSMAKVAVVLIEWADDYLD